ncbi:hypothetical protein [Candidatus Viadribacter manganicus]|uniref:Lipoprotein n=1 Tax=Candidatus Viadribacter manganicus TaxID=1759059 RepID=A0A1B1AFK8_9PROT|nr:hypothetical protein [Candidatus Viadribacter manganicus]ANP45334.1 hypothetical protein ATE48_05105 [Candidatus Viadribacter manganicus]
MRVFLIAGLAALAVAACTPAEEEHGALSEGCDARGVAIWNTPADPNASIEAITTGPDCARAVATLIIRNGSGEPIYSETHIPSQVMTLAQASTPAAMQTALQEWVDPASNTTMPTSSALPEWPANADSPQNGEFPFYPAEGASRESYNQVRDANVPLFCYVQGMESLNCLALRDGALESVGLQSFPG